MSPSRDTDSVASQRNSRSGKSKSGGDEREMKEEKTEWESMVYVFLAPSRPFASLVINPHPSTLCSRPPISFFPSIDPRSDASARSEDFTGTSSGLRQIVDLAQGFCDGRPHFTVIGFFDSPTPTQNTSSWNLFFLEKESISPSSITHRDSSAPTTSQNLSRFSPIL
ncbi:hypothetical protein K439DRAFT_1625474 [Ramaria rubella]|nr:hypothetical protein K439DRAFT_1625474 [Ramaria rubella]